jgi:hypothetical protein
MRHRRRSFQRTIAVVVVATCALPAAAVAAELPSAPPSAPPLHQQFSADAPVMVPPTMPTSASDTFRRLDELGFPVGDGDPKSAEARRGLCLAREFAGLDPVRTRLIPSEHSALSALQKPLPAPDRAVDGLNVSITCQAAYFVTDGVVERMFRVTTGAADSTPRGVFKVQRRTDGWRRSTLYPVMLYKPLNINGPIAVHGVPQPSFIRTAPASHGCVRLPNRGMDWLFPRLPIGASVRVYGRW